MSLNFVISPVGVWEVEVCSVMCCVGYEDMREKTGEAYVLLRELEILGSGRLLLAWLLAIALRVDGVSNSLLDLGLDRRPSHQEYYSARPGRSRVLWLLVRRLPYLLDVYVRGSCLSA